MRLAAARNEALDALMREWSDRAAAGQFGQTLSLHVDRPRATYGAWYEMFPRSSTPDPSRSGTFAEAEARLPEIAALGFEVAKYGFQLYVTSLSNYRTIYGSLAVVPLFLLWVYVSWYVVLVGAAVSATLAEGVPRGRATRLR